ncbi:MAG: glycosyltransferase family 2 protein [Armatimonadetes bacterium]|nr:glycosyltransferase family 2 protein [Armatimonadota bacterium]
MSPTASLGVSICIVAYNSLDKLRACLDSILAQSTPRAVETILVDNASAEPVAAAVAAEYPWVRLTANTDNLGFAGGTNLAVSKASHALRLLLNPDTVLPEPDTLERYCAAFEAEPGLGALGCHLQYPDGTTQAIVGYRPTAGWMIRDLLHCAPRRPALPAGDGVLPTEFISGAALLTSAATWQAVGPLDEGYFMYFEDVDWCRRAERLGYRLAAAPGIVIVHHEGASYGGREFIRREHFWRALVRYLRRHDGAAAAGALRVVLALGALVKLPLTALGDRSPQRAARLGLLRAQLRLGLWGP